MDDWLTESATQLASRIRTKQASSEAIVAVHIARAKQTQSAIHAVVRDRFDEALAEARAADARVASQPASSLPPLLGVPCSVKECFALTGMPQSAGLVSRKDFRASQDAVSVGRLRAAGAIPIGVTNTSELCMWMETSNRLYGRTSNAYDPTRTAGGSSGGEGAIVGAGAAPFGLGSDIGGSIRMPAFFNGVFGHKPSPGVVPNDGQFPIAHGAALRYLCAGPITRRAEDLWPLIKILAAETAPPGDPALVDLRGLVVLDIADNGRLAISQELRAAQVRAAHALARHGAEVRAFSSPRLRYSLEMWSVLMSQAGGPTFAELLGGGQPIAPSRALGRWALGHSDHTFVALALALFEKLPALQGDAARRFVDMTVALKDELTSAMGPHGVLLFPSYPSTAPRHHAPLLLPVQWMYTAIFNVLELPVTQVPLGLAKNGLPLGVQVGAGPNRDALTVAVAMALERSLGGWVPPRGGRAVAPPPFAR